MQKIQLNFVYCIIILVVIIFIIWALFGGQKYAFVGLDPLLQYEDINISFKNSELKSSVCSNSKFRRQMNAKQIKELERIRDEQEELLQADSEKLKVISAKKPKASSKGEAFAKNVIEEIYGVPFTKVRPDWLKNVETGRNLELDLYSDNVIVDGSRYKIAVEYNGIQHVVYPNGFNMTEEQFRDQIRRDIYKREVCDLNEVFLLTVPYHVTPDRMKEYIIDMIPSFMLPERYRK